MKDIDGQSYHWTNGFDRTHFECTSDAQCVEKFATAYPVCCQQCDGTDATVGDKYLCHALVDVSPSLLLPECAL